MQTKPLVAQWGLQLVKINPRFTSVVERALFKFGAGSAIFLASSWMDTHDLAPFSGALNAAGVRKNVPNTAK